jgi:hypothetical protein
MTASESYGSSGHECASSYLVLCDRFGAIVLAMVRRSTRWRSPPPKVLSLPTSERVIECYAIQGKAHHHWPLGGEVSDLLLVNARRETCWVRNAGGYGSPYECAGAPPGGLAGVGVAAERSIAAGARRRVR